MLSFEPCVSVLPWRVLARVRNTPQPDCFRVMLHMFTLLYLLLLPLISYDTLGYFVIPEGKCR